MLIIKNLYVSTQEKEILSGVNLEVKSGEIHAVMGPNGSGKSTLAFSLSGHPKYQITKGEINLDENNICEETPDERARKGLFLANQYPVAIPGLTVQSFLWQVYKKRNPPKAAHLGGQVKNDSIMSLIEFRKWIEAQAKALSLKPELLKRGLNDGFSGGEKKKVEILQMLVFSPKYIILDEIDSGLDIDAIKKIAQTIAKVAKDRNIGVIIITHYSRILKFLKPDKVHIMSMGKIIKSGGWEMVEKVESQGYSFEN